MYWILPISCKPMVVLTVWVVPEDDIRDPIKAEEKEVFLAAVTNRLGDQVPNHEGIDYQADFPNYGDLFEENDEMEPMAEPEAAMPEADEYSEEAYGEYLTAEVLLPRSGDQFRGTVKRRAKDNEGKPIGILTPF